MQQTIFHVNTDRCNGCAICVDACPMKILAVLDDRCVITDDGRCLECASCLRKCPEHAIAIGGHSPRGADAVRADTHRTTKTADVTPIMERLQDLLSALQLQQHFEWQGQDISSLDSFRLKGAQSYVRLYTAPKIEKIGFSSIDFFGSMTAQVVCISPGPAHTLPYYIMDWDESEDHIFFFCDLAPDDDLIRNRAHFGSYLASPLDELLQTFSAIPGLQNSFFPWVRALQSPYAVTGTIDKNPRKNVEMIYACAVAYLKVWIGMWQRAEVLDPQSENARSILQRRQNIRALFHENDPGGAPLNKFLGPDQTRKALEIIMP